MDGLDPSIHVSNPKNLNPKNLSLRKTWMAASSAAMTATTVATASQITLSLKYSAATVAAPLAADLFQT